MGSLKKIIAKMKSQPHGIIRQEADRVLAAHGYRLVRQKGSHCQYVNVSGDVITMVYTSPIKKAYIAALLERIGE